MKIHLIAIGGSVMHNMALALKKNGHDVSGSDDEIYEPARGRLLGQGLLPEKEGWDPDRISKDLDAVILGMHARPENPELLRAQELEIPVYSFPEYVYLQAKHKKRVVIAGSHGKTTTTAILLYVLKKEGRAFDFLVGAQLEGFGNMVQFSDAPVFIAEGDEYLASPIHRIPKFLYYKPEVAVITGIAWDHINVFPTFEGYKDQFIKFIHSLSPGATLIYNAEDQLLSDLVRDHTNGVTLFPFTTPKSRRGDQGTEVESGATFFPVSIFGAHNLRNLEAARLAAESLGISTERFWQLVCDFKGASKRMELIAASEGSSVIIDFAHAPSKVKAAVEAVRKEFPDHQLTACLELHTFSSLNKAFIQAYRHALLPADQAFVFYSPHTLKMKKMPPLEADDIKDAFDQPDLNVLTDTEKLIAAVEEGGKKNRIILLMSSGKFGNWNFREWSKSFLK